MRVEMTELKTSNRWIPNKYLRLIFSLIFMGSLVGLCLFAIIARSNSSSVHFSISPVENLLNEDGTLKLNTGFVGTLDLYGWDVKLDSKRGPVLVRRNAQTQEPSLNLSKYYSSRFLTTASDTSPTNEWSSLSNGGLNGAVRSIVVMRNELYVGGLFNATADEAVTNLNGIAKYSGGQWSALPNNGLAGVVYTMLVVGNELYVGGVFDMTGDGSIKDLGCLAKYSDGTWIPVVDKSHFKVCTSTGGTIVRALAFMNGDLYIGGILSPGSSIVKYRDQEFLSLAHNGLDGYVNALTVMGDNLIVAGNFSRTGDFKLSLHNIAKYSNETWSALSNGGLDGGDINALAVMNDDLYVGGSFDRTYEQAVELVDGIAKYSGGEWSALNSMGIEGGAGGISNIMTVGTDLYIGGGFYGYYGEQPPYLSYVAKYSNGAWSALSNDKGIYNKIKDPVFALAMLDGNLIAGGEFDNIADDYKTHYLSHIGFLKNSSLSFCPVVASSKNAVDSDGDGLLDCWETNGYDANGDGILDVDLPAMGADPNHKDIFVQIDYMVAQGHSHEPLPEAIKRVVDMFDRSPVSNNPDHKTGIHLHVDFGQDAPLTWGKTSKWGALSRSKPIAEQQYIVACTGDIKNHNYVWDEFYKIKNQNFPAERSQIFHYNIWAHSLCPQSNDGGLSPAPGRDFIVAQGDNWSYLNNLKQAGAFMHELGHNLGLCHGGPKMSSDSSTPCSGDVNIDRKPNYFSVMNDSFAYNGLIINNQDGNYDYSPFEGISSLNENALDEINGIDGKNQFSPIQIYGTIYLCNSIIKSVMQVNSRIDWNCDNMYSSNIPPFDINGDSTFSTLNSYSDWANLILHTNSISAASALTEVIGSVSDDISLDLAKEPRLYDVAINAPFKVNLRPGNSTTLGISVINFGTNDDVYTITYTAEYDWLDHTKFPLSLEVASHITKTVPITVHVPDNISPGTENKIIISASSHGNPNVEGGTRIVVTVTPGAVTPVFLPLIRK